MAIKTTKILIIFLVFSFLSANLSSAQLEQPETFEEAKEMGEDIVEVTKRDLPSIIKRIFKEQVLPIWQKMYDWFYTNIWLKLKNFFQYEVIPRLKGEYEKRKPQIEQEFKEEKEELKEELPELGKSIWERFKELWK